MPVVMMKLAYWVFTSGEEGVHGLDWGIKHASPAFHDLDALDVEYRHTLSAFGLEPKIVIPDNVGLVLLPFRDSRIVGFVFPGTDHGGRPNSSAVVALIPREVSAGMSVNDTLRALWNGSDIPGIARKNSQGRPPFLTLSADLGRDSPVFAGVVGWNDRVIQADGELRRLFMTDEPSNDEPVHDRRSNAGVIAACAGIMAVIAGGYFVFGDSASDEPAMNEPPATISQPLSHEPSPQPAIPQTVQHEPEPESAPSVPKRTPRPPRKRKFLDIGGLTEALRETLGVFRLSGTKGGFQFTVDAGRLPLEEWRRRKAEIFTRCVVEAGGNPGTWAEIDRDISADDIMNCITEIESAQGYRVVFRVSEDFRRTTYDFSGCMSEFVANFTKGDNNSGGHEQ